MLMVEATFGCVMMLANLDLLQVVPLVLLNLLLQAVPRDGCLRWLSVSLPLHLLEQVRMLAAQNKLLRQFDCATIRPKTLEMIGSGAGDALENLDGIA